MSSEPSPKQYFPGLNALRFFAAFSVLFHHLVDFQAIFGNRQYGSLHRYFFGGISPVVLFFTLSGFLITYLLLSEDRRTGTIGIFDFYVRRALRIWPLYYALVFFIFVVLPLIAGPVYPAPLPAPPGLNQLWFFLFLQPNFAVQAFTPVTGLAQTWTIGVEEQFYALWPLLMKRFCRRPLRLFGWVLAIKFAVYYAIRALAFSDSPQAHFWGVVRYALNNFCVECMVAGGLGAYLVFADRRAILRVLYSVPMQLVVLALFLAAGYYWIDFFNAFDPLRNFLLSTIFALFIVNLSCNPRALFHLEHPVLNALGRISYGIYMYHPAVIFLTLLALRRTSLLAHGALVYNGVVTAVVVIGTLVVSQLSFTYLESPALRLKARFER